MCRPYLCELISENGQMEVDVRYKIQGGTNAWIKEISRIPPKMHLSCTG